MTGRGRRATVAWRRGALAALIGLAIAVAYLGFRDAPLLASLEGQTLTWRFQMRGPVEPPDTVAIVAIDDRSVAALRRFPVPRQILADAVARLEAAGAAVIGIDLLLLEREQPAEGIVPSGGDRALREVLEASGRGVLAMSATFGRAAALDEAATAAIRGAAFRVVRRADASAVDGVPRAGGAQLPIEPLRSVAGLGHVNVIVDEDGSLRHLHAALAVGDEFVPALPVEIARRLLKLEPEAIALRLGDGLALGDRVVPLDRQMRLAVNHRGPAGTVPTHAMIDLLEDRVVPGHLAGRAVLIGATAVGVGDSFVTPFGRALPGVEVLATAVDDLATGAVIDRASRAMAWDLAAIVVLGLAAAALAHLPSAGTAIAGTVALLVGWSIAAQLVFAAALLWLDLTFTSASIAINTGCVALLRTVAARRERGEIERQRRNLSRYVSPVIADLLAESERPGFDDRAQRAAILFVDLAGFTRRAEHMQPADTVQFLRQFHRRIEQAALAHGGVIEQFTGDGAMVIFGMPSPGDNDAVAALACARAMAEELRGWNDELVRAGQTPLRFGIGIHYGPVVIARLGGQEQLHVTAAGDTVNVASRLEALTRAHATTIAISQAMVQAVRAARRADLLAGFTELPPQAIRGRDEKLSVWIAPAA